MSKNMQGNLMLLLAAIIWGLSFVAQKSGLDYIGPLAFNGIRTVIGGIVLIPLILITNKNNHVPVRSSLFEWIKNNKILVLSGFACGIALFVAGNLQMVGLAYTTTGHSGFITALYVVLVPIGGLLIFRRKVWPLLWCCIAASAFGLYLLCIPSGGFGAINKGDVITMICALCFTVHILLISHFSPVVDGVKLSCFQFFVAGILSIILMVPVDSLVGFDPPTLSTLLSSAVPILYSGVLSCGAGYTLQVVAQKYTHPTIASMIMCLESVFALLGGMVILHEMLSLREAIGCAIMFAAIIVSQVPHGESEAELPDKQE